MVTRRDLGGAGAHELRTARLLGKLDDIDLFAAQFADNRLHPHTLHADARADAIHVAIAAGDGNLGALAGFARATLDHHGAIVNFRNFRSNRRFDQLGIGGAKPPRQGAFDDLSTTFGSRSKYDRPR